MSSESQGPVRVVGRYALYGEIASGGMATVHIGRLLGPVGFARTVAIKRLHPQYAKDPEFVSMFLDEARLAARVQHPNVVATIDVVATDGELFLIMDYVRGESLSKLIRTAAKRGERVPPRIAASILSGFLHGLHAAHEAKDERGEPLGLVHRDVSPQNVLVGSDGIARVLDFGVAKAAGRIQVTREGQIKGKLAYMPPEQLQGHALTRQVDVYASGVVLWETLTGERLFKGDTEGETLTKILRDPIEPPSAVIAGLPRKFDAVVLKALSRRVETRYFTAREMARELESCVGLASATEVGEWVDAIAGSALMEREEKVAEIESNSSLIRLSSSGHDLIDGESASDVSGAPIGLPVPPPLPSERKTVGADRASSRDVVPGPPSGSAVVPPSERSEVSSKTTGSKILSSAFTLPYEQKSWLFAGGAGLFVAGLLVAFLATRAVRKPGVQPVASTSVDVIELPSGPEPLPSSPSATALPSASQSAAPSASTVQPIVAPPPPKTAPPIRPPPPPPRPSKNCDPPYTVDANGRRHYKVECL